MNLNPFKVKKGQLWAKTDCRPDEGHWDDKVIVITVHRNGYATVENTFTERKTRIRLDRFSPRSHLRRISA